MLNANIPATIYIDFKPRNTGEQLLQKIKGKSSEQRIMDSYSI